MTTRAAWRRNVRRSDPHKIALVCAGGGLTGAAYEVGCLLALDELLDRPTNALDVYLGISAGAVLTSLLANGISAAEMAAEVTSESGELFGVPASDLFRIDRRGVMTAAMALPRVLAAMIGWPRGSGVNPADAAFDAMTRLPDGFLDNSGVRECVRRAIERHGGTDSFDGLARTLYVLAVELDSGKVVAFGEPGRRDVPISLAVQASSAIPALCRPVPVGDRDYVDGAVRKTAHLRRVIHDGATLVLCINPMIPLGVPASRRSFANSLCETVRLTLHGRMQSALRAYAHEYPDTDVLVFEPSAREIREAELTLIRVSECPTLVEIGYRNTLDAFRANAVAWAPMLARHGVTLRDPSTVAPTLSSCAPPSSVAGRLQRSLRRLERRLGHAPAPETARA